MDRGLSMCTGVCWFNPHWSLLCPCTSLLCRNKREPNKDWTSSLQYLCLALYPFSHGALVLNSTNIRLFSRPIHVSWTSVQGSDPCFRFHSFLCRNKRETSGDWTSNLRIPCSALYPYNHGASVLNSTNFGLFSTPVSCFMNQCSGKWSMFQVSHFLVQKQKRDQWGLNQQSPDPLLSPLSNQPRCFGAEQYKLWAIYHTRFRFH